MVINTQANQVNAQTTQTETETLMFYISRGRLVKGKYQLRLGEYGGLTDAGVVKALATAHLGWGFISGMFNTYRDDEGNLYRSVERNEEDKELSSTFFSAQINLAPGHVSALEGQLSEEIKEIFGKPPKDEKGNSALKGYQLQVDLVKGAMARIQMERDDKKDKRMVIILDPSEVEAVKIVSSSEESYIRGGHRVPLKNVMATLLQGSKARKEETLEGTKALMKEMHSDPEGKYTKDKRKRTRGSDAANSGSAAAKVKEQTMD